MKSISPLILALALFVVPAMGFAAESDAAKTGQGKAAVQADKDTTEVVSADDSEDDVIVDDADEGEIEDEGATEDSGVEE